MDRGFDALPARLRLGASAWCCATAWRCSPSFGLVLWTTLHMFGVVPKGFIPDSDNDSLFVNLRAAQGTSFYEVVGVTEKITDMLNRDPEHRRDDGQHRRRPGQRA
jgi:multidrug efflux pump subunit AcrB